MYLLPNSWSGSSSDMEPLRSTSAKELQVRSDYHCYCTASNSAPKLQLVPTVVAGGTNERLLASTPLGDLAAKSAVKTFIKRRIARAAPNVAEGIESHSWGGIAAAEIISVDLRAAVEK